MVARTRTAEIVLSPDGIVVVKIASGLIQSPEDARDNLDSAIAAREGARRPALIDISDAEPLDPEVRHYYSGPKLAEWFPALAVVTTTRYFNRLMGNIYLRVARPGIPIRLFQDLQTAVEWLKEHRE